jgi:hypothetical protein
MDAQQQPRRSAWRFSLRELLLLMTTVAAVLALARVYYRRSEPFVPTKFSEQFWKPGQIALAMQRAGVSRPLSLQGSGGPHSHTESCSGSAHYVLEADDQELQNLIAELLREAERQIQKEEGRFIGQGSDAGLGHKGVSLEYRVDQTFGHIYIAGDPISNQKARLFIFIHEHRLRP